MVNQIIIAVFITTHIKIILGNYLDSEPSRHRPKLERNNVVNKGVWIRNKFNDNSADKAKLGDFIFRENSLDVDNLLQNNFDAFGENYMQDSPFVSAYVERQKRSSNNLRRKRPRKSIIGKNSRSSKSNENLESDKSKQINDLRRPSVFNDYPYNVAIVLSNNKKIYLDQVLNKTHEENANENYYNNTNNFNSTTVSINTDAKKTSNDTAKNVTSSKRSMKYDFETEIIKKMDFTEDINKTDENRGINDSKVNDRNVFDKDNPEWHQNVPMPDMNVYKVVPKEPVLPKSKPVTERGLIKVISMLTKTFKKIMRQHSEIKDIYGKISDINDEFRVTASAITNKFQDFDLKYLYLVKLQDKLKDYEVKMSSQEEYFRIKEKEIGKNFKEFENQQKKFLQQQKQFYNIQKIMLAQNEKINAKQNVIAKTQSEISHRQNNFARILKKAKQLYIDSRHPAITKLSSSISKMKAPSRTYEPKLSQTSTRTPEIATDSIKINLFSIPTSNKVQTDPDELILKEKDDQAIDDLVYKYYFNNTYIDTFMKNKILNTFMSNIEIDGGSRNVKNKRNEFETTILLPVMELNESENLEHNRERRWINHHSKRKSKRRDRGKTVAQILNATDEKRPKMSGGTSNNYFSPPVVVVPERNPDKDTRMRNDPFLTMAQSFCNEIHQNSDTQMLSWCIEKALRRLQFLDGKNPMPPTAKPVTTTSTPKQSIENIQKPRDINLIPLVEDKKKNETLIAQEVNHQTEPTTTITRVFETTAAPHSEMTSPTLITTDTTYTNLPIQKNNSRDPLNFPDNEELELNLKQFEITPDNEGNVYFEGSVHAKDSESQGVDDIMPGLESNSHVDVDPLAFDMQAKRRAFVRKLNERIRKSLG